MNLENPNTMIVQFFMQGKSQELMKIFKKGTPQEKVRAIEILQKSQLNGNIVFPLS